MRRTLLAALVTSTVWTTTLTAPRPVAADVTDYVSIGDSVAFGETDFTHDPSFGDRGYVAPYADFLATQDGGVRPNVINLAIDGETTSSFFTGVGRVAPVPDAFAAALNLNYTSPPPTQNSLLLSTIAAEQQAGHTIGTVTLNLGSNDLFALALSPGFSSLPPDQQQALLLQTLGLVQSHYTTLLTELRGLLPQANLLLLGTYDPFPAVPSSPFASLAGPAIQGLNQLIAAEAVAFGGRYVDTFTPFVGREGELTHILDPPAGSDNVHPNAAGYAAIAGQLEAVPEPSSLILMGAGALGFFVTGWWRRRRADDLA